jgi:1,4-dihydroxy-6-naphthoate synthase
MDPVIAVPGEKTTAFLVLNMMLGPGSFRHEVLPSDRIIPSLIDKTHQVGLVIHEAQLSYQDEGLHMIEDLGSWWHRHTGHPLPLGLNVVRSDLDQIHGDGTIAELTKLLHESVSHAIAHHEESLGYTMNFARDMGIELAGRFVDLYINHRTLDFGAEGVAAIEELTRRGVQMGLLQQQEPVEVVWHR